MTLFQNLLFARSVRQTSQVPLLPATEIRRRQTNRLATLVRIAKEQSPFYQDRFRHIDQNDFELEQLPVTSKAEMIDAFDDLLTVRDIRLSDLNAFILDERNLGRWFRGEYCVFRTSGSQGSPLFVVQNRECLSTVLSLMGGRSSATQPTIAEGLRYLFRPKKVAIVTFRRGFYPSGAVFEFLDEVVGPLIQTRRFSSAQDDLVDQLNEYQPQTLVGYSSTLEALATDDRLQLKSLKQISSSGEQLTVRARRRIEAKFGVPIIDHYGMGECLQLADECKHGRIHVNSDWAILEVVDESNQPVPDGVLGSRILVTNLANTTQPFIRYIVEDRMAMRNNKSCGCGSHLPWIEQIDGRSSDLIWVENESGGSKFLSGVLFHTVLDRFRFIREWQIQQLSSRQLVLYIEHQDHVENVSQEVAFDVCEHLYNAGLPRVVTVEIKPRAKIAANPVTGKLKRLNPLVRA